MIVDSITYIIVNCAICARICVGAVCILIYMSQAHAFPRAKGFAQTVYDTLKYDTQ